MQSRLPKLNFVQARFQGLRNQAPVPLRLSTFHRIDEQRDLSVPGLALFQKVIDLSFLSGDPAAVRARKQDCLRNTLSGRIMSAMYSILRRVNVSGNFIKEHSLSSRLADKIYKIGSRQPDFIAVWTWSNLLVEKLTGEEL